ncbi:VOC family protein [Marispirochaeta aestuarii]|uniref:VOC family protein n=1 Tax=Marispirochaeta aestuarii TaxID=1963862 RepID=UPI002ABDEC06|nr:VOC family protein [Marispirochaeta aestuarii]
MSKISACIWLDTQAEEAAAFYTSIFPNSRITGTTHYTEAGKELHGKEPGSVMTVLFEAGGFSFTALNGGPYFALNPSISFFVRCENAAEVDRLWKELSTGGTVLMALDSYFFSERYGWIQDRFGVSWQLILAPESLEPRIVPSLLFVRDVCGKAEEAMNFYTSVFRRASMGEIARYGTGQEPDAADSVMYGEFSLEGRKFAAMDSAQEHTFGFNEGVSLLVDAQSQEEIDHYWKALSAVPESEQCGWLKDRYGISWQIFPDTEMNRLLQDGDEVKSTRTLEAMFTMKKIDLEGLRRAAAG